jgi:hypothetical protein
MFVGDEVRLDVGFAVARDRLASVARGSALVSTAQEAYDQESASLVRVGAAGLSKLARVQTRELAWDEESAGMAIRWEATGTGDALFPVLDADIRLAPAGDQVTVLRMAGSFRPPLGIPGQAADRAIRNRIAGATIHNFLRQVAEQITRGDHLHAAEAGQRSLRRNGSSGSCGVTLTCARATTITPGAPMTRFRSRLATSGSSSASRDIRSRRSRSPSR